MGTFSTTMPDGTTLSGIPEGTTQSEILARYSKAQAPQQQAPADDIGEFVKGTERAADQMGALATEALPAFAKSLANQTFGTNFDNSGNFKAYQQKMAEAEKNNPAKIPSYKDIKSPGDVVDYIASTMGEQVPNLALGIASGGLGGSLAEMTASQLAKQAGIQLSKEATAAAMQKGAALGIGATLLPQNVSGNYMDYMAEGKDKPFHALATGGLQTGLQMLPQMNVVNKLIGEDLSGQVIGNSLLRKFGIPEEMNQSLTKIAGHTADSALQFAGANMGSTALGILGDHFVDQHRDMFTKDNMQSIIDQGLKGLVGGAVMGAAASGLEGRLAPDDKQIGTSTKTYTDLYGAMKPTYVDDNVLMTAPKMGLNSESLANLHPDQIKQTMTAIQDVLKPVDAAPVINPQEMKIAIERYQSDKPKDYVPGDGVIHAGTTVRDDDVQGHPAQRVAVDDPDALDKVMLHRGSSDDKFTVYGKTFGTRVEASNYKHQIEFLNILKENHDTGGNGETFLGMRPVKDINIERAKVSAELAKNYIDPSELEKAHKLLWDFQDGRDNFEDANPHLNGEAVHKAFTKGMPDSDIDDVYKAHELMERAKENAKLEEKRKGLEEEAKGTQDYYSERYHNQLQKDGISKEEHETVSKNPRSIKRTSPDSKAQRTDTLHGDLYSDGLVPARLARNLIGLPLKPEYRENHRGIVDGMHRILGEVFGNRKPNLEFYKSIFYGAEKDPVLGAQFKNTIALALHDSTHHPFVPETMYHESFHMLMERGAFKPSEIEFMLRNTDLLKKYFDRDAFLAKQDWDRFMETPGGKEEILANAMGKMAKEYNADRKSVGSIPAPFKEGFRKFKNFLEKTANFLKGQGLHSINDIVKRMVEGEIGGREEDYKSRQFLKDFDPRITDMAHDLSVARLMRAAKDRRTMDIDDLTHYEKLKNLAEKFRKEREKLVADENQRMGWWGRKVSAMYMQGQKIPLLGLLYNSADRRMNNAQEMLSNYGEAIHPWANLSKEHRMLTGNWADNLQARKLKAYVNKDGILSYKDKVRDPVTKLPIWDEQTKSHKYAEFNLMVDGDQKASREAAKGYMALQEGFKRQLDDWEGLQKKLAFEDYPNYMPENFTQKDINAKIDEMPKNDKGKTVLDSEENKALYNRLVAVRDQLDAIDAMRKQDYMPQSRFGSHAYVVRDRTKITKEYPQGVPVSLPTIEQGTLGRTYDMAQKKAVMEMLKEKYGDTKKYDVIGMNGKIKNFDHLTDHPFAMTHNKLESNIDPRFINVETLSSLLASRNLDPSLRENIHRELSIDISTKKFAKKFDRREGMDGYSKDWDRVVHGHMSGSAHFLSGIQHQREVSIIKGEIDKLASTDPKLHSKATDFIDYTNSPQEDYQRLRTANMLWVMGGNVGTALTVAMTLPTTTLGQLAKYDSNFLRNGQRMAKWSALSHQILSSTNPREVIKLMVDRGKIKEEQGAAFLKFMQLGKVRSEMMSESVGKLKQDALSNTARYLGAPVAYMERMVRAATLMAAHEALLDNPDAKARAERVLAYDHNFQASRLMDKSKTFEEAAALNIMDKSHGVYGKLGRPDMFKGLGGSLFMPFQTFPYYALSSLAKSLGEGKEGKIAFATTVGALMFFCGVQGIPGVEQLEDLYEEASKAAGHEQNLELMLLEKVYGITGDKKAAEFITHGFGNAYAGVDGSKRWGLPIPGYDTLKAVAGIGGSKPSNVMGVEGTVLQGLGNAWREYKAGSGPVDVLKAMMPSGVSSPLKALSYATDGVWTNPNSQDMKTRLIAPEEVSNWTKISRALGITSSQVAEARDRNFDAKLANTQYEPMLNEYKSRVSVLETRIAVSKDPSEKRAALAQLVKESNNFAQYMKDQGYAAPMGAINSAIRNQVFKNYTTTPKLSKNPTIAKQQLDIINMYKEK